jgi:hypothetical protein
MLIWTILLFELHEQYCLVCGDPFSSHEQPYQNNPSSSFKRNPFSSPRQPLRIEHMQFSQNDHRHWCAEDKNPNHFVTKWGRFMFSLEPQLLNTCEASGKHTDAFGIPLETDIKRLQMFSNLYLASVNCPHIY